jgi:hypothetical protein
MPRLYKGSWCSWWCTFFFFFFFFFSRRVFLGKCGRRVIDHGVPWLPKSQAQKLNNRDRVQAQAPNKCNELNVRIELKCSYKTRCPTRKKKIVKSFWICPNFYAWLLTMRENCVSFHYEYVVLWFRIDPWSGKG